MCALHLTRFSLSLHLLDKRLRLYKRRGEDDAARPAGQRLDALPRGDGDDGLHNADEQRGRRREGAGVAVPARAQGLTLVHFSA